MSKHQVIISRSETVDIVGLAEGVPAKVDSGAFRSSIHASNVKIIQRDGIDLLTCKLLNHPSSPQSCKFETSEFSQVVVVNSFGRKEQRYEVSLRVKLGSKVFNTSFTLANRSNNLFPILLGRKLLKGRFLIDVNTSNIDRKQLQEKQGNHLSIVEEELE